MSFVERIRPLLVLPLACAAPCAAQLQFGSPTFLPTGDEPIAVFAADVDLDADLDLLVHCRGSQAMFIHWNDGRGRFPSALSIPLAHVPFNNGGHAPAAVGDLNGDCLPDIVVQGSPLGTILFADGSGGFTSTVMPYALSEAVLADIDADLDLDLLIETGGHSSILTLFNDGVGNFAPGTPITPFFLVGFGVGDFNEDGLPDICHGNWGCSTGNGTILRNFGSGQFGVGGFFTVGGCEPGYPLVADATGDGHLDIVIRGYSFPRVGNVLRGSGTGAFQSVLTLPESGRHAVGDVDRDGTPDVLHYRSAGQQDVYLGDGSGGFHAPSTWSSIAFDRVADLDGDGAADFLFADSYGDAVRIVANRSIEWQREPVSGHWYALTRRANWAGAELDAVALGGHLVTVGSAMENQWLTSTFGGDRFVGYTDAAVEGVWEWVAGDPFGYENWAPGEPDNAGDSDFCRLDPNGLWYDAPSTTELRGIVELVSDDCDANGRPDAFEIAIGWTEDVNGDGVPDHCVSPYFCPANPNSSGGPAEIALSGTPAVGIDTVHLEVTGLPTNRFGYFLMSDSQGYIPMVGGGQGDFCLGLPFIRFAGDILNSGASGTMSYTPDLVHVPGATVAQGSSWQFQCWFRDQNPGPTSNLSNAVHVTYSASALPIARFAPPCTGLEEEATQFDIAVELSWAHDMDVVLPYAVSGDATYGVDWRVETVNPLVIPAGQTSGTLRITVAEDAAPEATETGRIELSPSSTVRVGPVGTYELRIRDDD